MLVALKNLQFKIGTDIKYIHFKYNYFPKSHVSQISMLKTFFQNQYQPYSKIPQIPKTFKHVALLEMFPLLFLIKCIQLQIKTYYRPNQNLFICHVSLLLLSHLPYSCPMKKQPKTKTKNLHYFKIMTCISMTSALDFCQW